MAAHNMPALMRDNADHLIGRLGGHQRAGMHEHVVTVDHEGVEAAVVDDVDLNALRAEPGSVEDGLGISADQRLCFGVANNAPGLRRGRADKRDGQAGHGCGTEPSPTCVEITE
jgi:hypothetical protein